MGLDILLCKVKEPGYYKANFDENRHNYPFPEKLVIYPEAVVQSFYDVSHNLSVKKVMKKFKDFVYTDTEEFLVFNKNLIYKYYASAYAGTSLYVDWDYSLEVDYDRFWIKEFMDNGKPHKILYESKPEDCVKKEFKVKCLDIEENYFQRKGMKSKFFTQHLPQNLEPKDTYYAVTNKELKDIVAKYAERKRDPLSKLTLANDEFIYFGW